MVVAKSNWEILWTNLELQYYSTQKSQQQFPNLIHCLVLFIVAFLFRCNNNSHGTIAYSCLDFAMRV